MRLALICLAATVALIAGFWAWLGQTQPLPQTGLVVGQKLWCVSYAPFQGSQTPYDPNTMIPAPQIEADIVRLSKMSDCVRVYSTDQGLENVVPLAAKYGMKVLQGIWVSNNAAKTQIQVEAALAIANQYPETVRAIVVGNEALLRGDIAAPELAALIRTVKARAKVPVTYADVWEFWLRAPEVAAAVDFLTIHILPYWEDFPIPAHESAAHVDAIRKRVAAAFAPKDVVIGEVGWPSQGRMREGALPSPSNQAGFVQEVLALAQRENYRVNIIEAFDQPWKRAQEGVVGGHWGLFDDANREAKFVVGVPVSNHPHWRLQAIGGMIFAIVIFGIAIATRRERNPPSLLWLGVTANALAGGVTIGWALALVPIESLGIGGWIRCIALAAVALLSPLAVAAAMMRGVALPRFSRIIGPETGRFTDPLTRLVGVVVMATLLLALISALGLVFDPRYRDFPFAPLTAAIVPFFVHSLVMPRPVGARGTPEIGGAIMLALSAIYIVPNETVANWQSLWLCAAFALFAFSLARVRDARN